MSVELTQAERDAIALELKLDDDRARKLQKAYNADPELWRSKGITAALAETIARRGFRDATTATVALATYQGKIRELSKPTDTELERSLIEHIALCLLRLQELEAAYPEHGSIELFDYWDRHLAAAQRRFLNACTALARVKRLALPVVQLNIGDKQINVAQVNSKG